MSEVLVHTGMWSCEVLVMLVVATQEIADAHGGEGRGDYELD